MSELNGCPKAALIFPTLGLDIGIAHAGLQLAWSLGPSRDAFITKGLARIYKGAPNYEDLVNFPYRLKAEDLQADIWLTGNILPCTQALKRVQAIRAKPSYILAHIPSLEEAPALIRSWRETRLFAQIEWVSEPCWEYACHVQQLQYYLCGTLKSAREIKLKTGYEDEKNVRRPNDLVAWGRGGLWAGPLNLDPTGDDGHPISVINAFRSGAVCRIVASLLSTLARGEGIRKYDDKDAFAQFKPDEKSGSDAIVKLTDGGIQRLLDGSLENFYDVWPANGCCDERGLLLKRERDYVVPASPLPALDTVRNVRYIAAMLGLPDYWLPD